MNGLTKQILPTPLMPQTLLPGGTGYEKEHYKKEMTPITTIQMPLMEQL